MITIEDQFRMAVLGDGLRFRVARADVTTVFGGKPNTFKAVVDLDTDPSQTRDGQMVIKILGTFSDRSLRFRMRSLPVVAVDFHDDNYAVDTWVDRATSGVDSVAGEISHCYSWNEVKVWVCEDVLSSQADMREASRYRAWLKSHMSESDRKEYYAAVAAKAKATRESKKGK